MASLKAFLSQNDQSIPAMSGEIFERHQDTINVKKRHVAVAKLVRIISAALSISNERGFRAMSLRDLAREADLSMGALYAYFDSKETLLMIILLQVRAVALRVLQIPPELAGLQLRSSHPLDHAAQTSFLAMFKLLSTALRCSRLRADDEWPGSARYRRPAAIGISRYRVGLEPTTSAL